MRKITLFIISIFSLASLWAQEEKANFKFTPYGFIRNDFYFDSRQNLETANGLFYIMPLDKAPNGIGEDVNNIPSSAFFAIAARLGIKISGPDVLGAKSSARIETDFAGFGASTTMLRIRQAWCKLEWNKVDLLAGQTWHPMFGDVIPTVQSLATGSPFQPFNRSPQVRVDYKFTPSFKTYFSALYEFQYMSAGPNGSSQEYQKNAIVPELYLGLDFKKNGWIVGAGASFLRLRPRVNFENEDTGLKRKVSDNINSFSMNAFLQYTNDLWAFKAKTIYGQNMAHLLLMSGYAVSDVNSDGSFDYTNLKNSTSWANITYGKKTQIGLFAGYSKNLGSDDRLESRDMVYVMGFPNLDKVYRVAPQVSYNLKHWTFGVEYERTTASYGTMDLNDGKVKDTHDVTNNRVVAVMMYLF